MKRLLLPALASLALVACSGADTNPLDTRIPWNADAEDVQTTGNGLQYVVIEEGPEDGETPAIDDRVRVMYEGRLNDGTVFDSSYESGQPAVFGVGQVIPGWTQGLQLMSEGDEFVFYIPSELAYGQNPRPGSAIKPGDDLIFRVELMNIVEPKTSNTEAWDEYTPWDSERKEVQKTGSGLEYVVLESGDESAASPAPGDTIAAYYEGRFASSGEKFDSAYDRGEPLVLQANQVIPGWQEALTLMKPGDHWLVHIPSDLAYGPKGHPAGIPPNSDLNFEVELVEVMETR